MTDKNIIVLLLNIVILTSCNGQEKDATYLIFESGNSDICHVSAYRDGSNKKKTAFVYEKETLNDDKIAFKICSQIFIFNPKSQTKKVISINNVNISTIDYLFNKLEEKPFLITKKTLAKYIY